MLFGASLMPVNIFLRAPAFLMSMEFRGWKAILFFAGMGTLDAVIGTGLLKLAWWSRVAAIYFFVFRMANTLVTFLRSRSRAAFEGGVAAMQAALGQPAARRSPVWFGPVVELSLMALILWVLSAQKEVFSAQDGQTP